MTINVPFRPVTVFWLAVLFFVPVRAGWWEDFTNNLATDLAPLITLFGEQATKQFMSESIDVLDYLLMATAPLGILTIIVSAIRVCGGPSLRAFIGRAREGGGIAEAELCSSTSRDVCELYHSGAITRVFGRPKILEIIHDPKRQKANDGSHGIYLPEKYFDNAKDNGWEEKKKGRPKGHQDSQKADQEANRKERFAPNPNMSINVGIKRYSTWIYWTAAVCGLIFQSSVLIFCAIATYLIRHLRKDGEDNAFDPWGFPCVLSGTILVFIGMFCCAHLVGESTTERHFEKGDAADTICLRIIQPGNQNVGDQTFDPFSFQKENLDRYTTSWKPPDDPDERILGLQKQVFVFAATVISVVGFVLQFLGLRSVHASVSLMQLLVTLIMSIIRAGLRAKRMSPEENLLGGDSLLDKVVGHELDWLSMDMNDKDGWCVTCGSTLIPPSDTSPNQDDQHDQYDQAFYHRFRLAALTSRKSASDHPRPWDASMVCGRTQAQRLKKTIEDTIRVLTAEAKWDPLPASNVNGVLTWNINTCSWREDQKSDCTVAIPIDKKDSRWTVDDNHLEAVVSLWSWSMSRHPPSSPNTLSEPPGYRRILSIGKEADVEKANTGIELWVGDLAPSISLKAVRNVGWSPISALDPFCQDTNGLEWKTPPITSFNLVEKFDIMKTTDENDSEQNGMGKMGLGNRYDREHNKDSDNGVYEVFGMQLGAQVDFPGPQGSLFVSSISMTPEAYDDRCAHDVYQAFLCAILPQVVLDHRETVISNKGDTLSLEHPVVTRLVECFHENSLGSKEQASLLVISALQHCSRLPLGDEAVASAYQQARKRRKSAEQQKHADKAVGDLEKASRMLRWACATFPAASEPTLLELGELYRHAFFKEPQKDDWRKFGKSGILWMNEKADEIGVTPDLKAVAERYHKLLGMCHSTAPSAEKLIQAVRKSERADALYYVSKLDEDLTSSYEGLCALPEAAGKGWYEIVSILAERGISVNDSGYREDWKTRYEDDESTDGEFGRAPIIRASRHGHMKTVRVLLELNAVPGLTDNDARDALSHAAEMGHTDVLHLLLENQKASIFHRDKRGWTALHQAASSGQHDAIACLKMHGADTDARDGEGLTPLLVAITRPSDRRQGHRKRIATANMIIGTSREIQAEVKQLSAWMWAIQEQEWECLEYCLNNDKSLSSLDVDVEIWCGPHFFVVPDNSPPPLAYQSEPGLSDLRRNRSRPRFRFFGFESGEWEPCRETLPQFLRANIYRMRAFWGGKERPENHGVEEKEIKDIYAMRAFLGQATRRQSIPLTADMVKMAQSGLSSRGISTRRWALEALCERPADEVTKTQDAVAKIFAQTHHPYFDQGCQDLLPSLIEDGALWRDNNESLVVAAIRATSRGHVYIRELIRRYKNRIVMTEKLVLEAVTFDVKSIPDSAITKFLIENYGDEVVITKRIVIKAVSSYTSRGFVFMEMLSNHHPMLLQSPCDFHRRLMKLAATKGAYLQLKWMLSNFGCAASFKEDIAEEALQVGESASNTLRMLCEEYKDKVSSLDHVVREAADVRTPYHRRTSLQYLFKYSDDKEAFVARLSGILERLGYDEAGVAEEVEEAKREPYKQKYFLDEK